MLKTQRIYREWSIEDIFSDGQWCPVCLGTEFTYIEGQDIYCDHCNATFTLRSTAGDPGVVVDCDADPQGIYASTDLAEGETLTKWGNPYYFCQVIKTCDGGLESRDRWLSHTKHGHEYTREKATEQPCFGRLYYFNAAEQKVSSTCPNGMYFAHQCEKVIDDFFWIHRCIPKVGERPVLTKYPIYRRPDDHSQYPSRLP